jgi:hypothetical protein
MGSYTDQGNVHLPCHRCSIVISGLARLSEGRLASQELTGRRATLPQGYRTVGTMECLCCYARSLRVRRINARR